MTDGFDERTTGLLGEQEESSPAGTRYRRALGITEIPEEVEPRVKSTIQTYTPRITRKAEQSLRFRGIVQEETPLLPKRDDLFKPDDNRSDLYDLSSMPSTKPMGVRDVTNFLFGEDMAIIGAKWDEEGFNWSMDNLVTQWAEEPVWSAIGAFGLGASIMFPALRAARVGKIGQITSRGFKIHPEVAKHVDISDGKRYFELFGNKVDEVDLLKRVGALDRAVKAGDVSNDQIRGARAIFYSKNRRADLYHKKHQARTWEVAYRSALAETEGDEVAARRIVESMEIPEAHMNAYDKFRFWFDRQFGQRYFAWTNDLTPEGIERQKLNDALAARYDSINFGSLADDMRAAGGRGFIYKFYQRAIKEMDSAADVGQMRKWAPDEDRIYQNITAQMRAHQQEMRDVGFFLTDDIPELHFPALTKAGPIRLKPVRRLDEQGLLSGSLVHPTLHHRKATLQEVWERVQAGNIQADDVPLFVQGMMNDRMLLFNYETIRDIAGNRHGQFAYKVDDLIKAYGKKARTRQAALESIPGKDYVSLDTVLNRIPEGATVRARIVNMMRKAGLDDMIGAEGELPYLDPEIANLIFDPQTGFLAQGEVARMSLFEILTAAYKTSKTAFNPGTHVLNTLGNIAFLSQRGFNVMNPSNVKLLHDMTDVYQDIHRIQEEVYDLIRKGELPERLRTHRPDFVREVAERMETAGRTIKYGDKTISMDELVDPMVRQIWQEGTLDVETFGALRRGGAKGITEAFRKGLVDKVFDQGFGRVGIGRYNLHNLLKRMSAWYMGEDVIPKMAMYVQGRANGLSMGYAFENVARGMPMYGTTGTAIQHGRRWLFPWLTFPAEAMRITKNNLMDHPLRMLPWLHATQIAQTTVSSLGLGPETPLAAEEAKRQLPFWAQTPGTLTTTEEAATNIGIGATTALGALTGAVRAGPRGAAIGAGLGLGGAAITHKGLRNLFEADRDTGDRLRGAVLNWLPHTSFLPRTKAEDYHLHGVQDFIAEMPAEPLAIFRPMIEIAMGRGPFGQEIKASGPIDQAGKVLAGYIGFISPPWFQKYGLKVTTPDVGLVDAFGAGTLAGPATLGALTGFGAAGVPGAVVGGAAGLGLGAGISNTSRLLVDTGMDRDSVTGEKGAPILDLFLNNVGAWKTYVASPEQYYSNMMQEGRAMKEARNYWARNLAFWAQQGDEAHVGEILRKVWMTFHQEYPDNPRRASEKFREYVEGRLDAIGRHPKLRSFSQEELREQLREASRFAADTRERLFNDRIASIRSERRVRKMQ